MLRADGESEMNPSEQHNGKVGTTHERLSHLGCKGEKAVGSKEPFFSQHRLYSVLLGCVFSLSPQVQVWVPFLGDLGEEGHLCTFPSVLDTSVCVTNATSV